MNDFERYMMQLDSITPKTPDEFVEAMKKNDEQYKKARKMLDDEIIKRNKVMQEQHLLDFGFKYMRDTSQKRGVIDGEMVAARFYTYHTPKLKYGYISMVIFLSEFEKYGRIERITYEYKDTPVEVTSSGYREGTEHESAGAYGVGVKSKVDLKHLIEILSGYEI